MAVRSGFDAQRFAQDFLGLQVAAVGQVHVGLGHRVDVAGIELARRVRQRGDGGVAAGAWCRPTRRRWRRRRSPWDAALEEHALAHFLAPAAQHAVAAGSRPAARSARRRPASAGCRAVRRGSCVRAAGGSGTAALLGRGLGCGCRGTGRGAREQGRRWVQRASRGQVAVPRAAGGGGGRCRWRRFDGEAIAAAGAGAAAAAGCAVRRGSGRLGAGGGGAGGRAAHRGARRRGEGAAAWGGRRGALPVLPQGAAAGESRHLRPAACCSSSMFFDSSAARALLVTSATAGLRRPVSSAARAVRRLA